MNPRICLALLGSFLLTLTLAPSVSAQLAVVFGETWDAPDETLQHILDNHYGAGLITVETDYIGANVGDPDPFYWTGLGFDSFLVMEIAGNANLNLVGWYKEDGQMPIIDNIDDGVLFDGPSGAGHTVELEFGPDPVDFGFYMNPNGDQDAQNAPEPEHFFSNRLFNDLGPDGSGAVHAPYDGDVQAIVFDVSAWTQPFTWVVCFEDLDSGPIPSECCQGTDNDFNDFVFEVTVTAPVPVQPTTFGAIKRLYR
jgi:hypothetical protein